MWPVNLASRVDKQPRVETVEEFKLRIAAMIRGKPEHIPGHRGPTRYWSGLRSGRSPEKHNVVRHGFMHVYEVRPRKGFRMDDSRWIKWFAIATAVLTAVLLFLTIVLARYASRLDVLTDALVAWQRSNHPSSPTPEQSPSHRQLSLYQGRYP